MNFRLVWLPEILRAAGLTAIEEDGWRTRGHGDMSEVCGVLFHDTAGRPTGDAPSLSTVIEGRPDLAGPLAHLLLARSGAFHIIAAGKAWHAGEGQIGGVSGNYNASLIGIEAENAGDGKDPWPQPQMDAGAKGVAAILTHCNLKASMCMGHKEYALPVGRKVDPTFDMDNFRCEVAKLKVATNKY